MSTSNLSKGEKERQKLIQEKCQTMLNDMLRDDDNKYCVDCDAKGPRWASWNLGIFLCIRCAGIHRNLGVHISKVKSVNLDTWTPEQVVSMTVMGNSRGRAVYEANLPEAFRRPQTDAALESFIRGKYEQKKYIAKEFVPQKVGKVDWTQEIEEEMKRRKEKSKLGGNSVNPLFPKLTIPPGSVSRRDVQTQDIKRKPADNPINIKETKIGEVKMPPPAEKEEKKSDSALLFDLIDNDNNGINNTTTNTTSNNAGFGTTEELLSELSLGGEGKPQSKMTKESILSLYGGQQQGQPQQQQPQLLQQLQQQNPFLQQQFPQQQQQQPQQQNLFGGLVYPQQQQQMFPQQQQQLNNPMTMNILNNTTSPPSTNQGQGGGNAGNHFNFF